MQFPTAKNSLNKQSRQGVQAKRLKNHDRILYINGLFAPPKSQDQISSHEKESEEWRSLFTMFLIAGFGAVMLLISVIGNYGILATNRLETHEQTLIQALDSMELDKILMNEEIAALNLSKYRNAQQELEETEERTKLAEMKLYTLNRPLI